MAAASFGAAVFFLSGDPMLIREALRLPMFSGLSAADSLAVGLAAASPILVSELQTVAALTLAVGSENNARVVLSTMKAAAAGDVLVEAFWLKLCGQGVDFSNGQVQAMILVLAAAGEWSGEITTAVQGMGIRPQTVFDSLGVVPAPTLGEITTALHANSVADFCAHVMFEILPAQLAAGASIETIKSVIAGA